MQLPSTHQTISYGDKENDELVRMVSYLECSSKKDNFQLAAAILTAKEPSTMDIEYYLWYTVLITINQERCH